jgi:hypothetical protein
VADRWLGYADQGGWLCGATVLTPTDLLQELDLGVVDGRIAEFAPRKPGRRGWDCSGLLIVPGLANAHFRSASTLLRGVNAGLQLAAWVMTAWLAASRRACSAGSMNRRRTTLSAYLSATSTPSSSGRASRSSLMTDSPRAALLLSPRPWTRLADRCVGGASPGVPAAQEAVGTGGVCAGHLQLGNWGWPASVRLHRSRARESRRAG